MSETETDTDRDTDKDTERGRQRRDRDRERERRETERGVVRMGKSNTQKRKLYSNMDVCVDARVHPLSRSQHMLCVCGAVAVELWYVHVCACLAVWLDVCVSCSTVTARAWTASVQHTEPE